MNVKYVTPRAVTEKGKDTITPDDLISFQWQIACGMVRFFRAKVSFHLRMYFNHNLFTIYSTIRDYQCTSFCFSVVAVFFLSLLKKVLLEILQNAQRTPVPESLFIKVVGLILQVY